MICSPFCKFTRLHGIRILRKIGSCKLEIVDDVLKNLSLSINNVCAISNMRQMLNYDNTWFASYPTARSYMLGFTITF